MEILPQFIYRALFVAGLFLLPVGLLFIFLPSLMVKMNALGNIWFGKSDRAVKYSSASKGLLHLNYAIFTRHRITGVVLMGVALIFISVFLIFC